VAGEEFLRPCGARVALMGDPIASESSPAAEIALLTPKLPADRHPTLKLLERFAILLSALPRGSAQWDNKQIGHQFEKIQSWLRGETRLNFLFLNPRESVQTLMSARANHHL